MSKRFLKRFRKPKVFSKITMYQQAKDILFEKGFVVLKGNTGEGKTTAALAMLASLYEKDDILVPSSAEHWKYVNKHTVGAMLINDFLGSMHFNENDFQEWKDYLPHIPCCCSVVNEKQNTAKRFEACGEKMDRPGVKVIITLRKRVFDLQKKLLAEYKIFNEKYIVVFSSKGCHVSRLMSSDWCLSELKSSLGVAARRRNYDIYSAIVSMDIDIPDKLLIKKQNLTSLKIVTDFLKEERLPSPVDIPERELASGASNRETILTDQPRPDDNSSSRDRVIKSPQPGQSDKINEVKMSRQDGGGNSSKAANGTVEPVVEKRADSKIVESGDNDKSWSPDSTSDTRAPPEGHELSPTTEREPNQLVVINKEAGLDDDDDDDGGWNGKQKQITNTGKYEGSQRPHRAILQGTSLTNEQAQEGPQPMSNNLVVKNGRVPASWQQSTVFKSVSPHVVGSAGKQSQSTKQKAELPAVQTTLRADEHARITNTLMKKKTAPKYSKSENNYVRYAKIVAKVGSDLLRLTFFYYMERQQPQESYVSLCRQINVD